MAKPNSKKTEPTVGSFDDLYQSAFEVPSEVTAELKAQNLAYRWINAKQFKESFGFHKNRWQPFKSAHMQKLAAGVFGGDPEGYVRRGDMILAAKPKEIQEKHRAHIKQLNELRTPGAIEQKRKEAMREIAKEHGFKASSLDTDYESDEE